MLLLEYPEWLVKMRKSKVVYALYKGDTFLELGTVPELAKYLNVKESTIKFYTTKTYRKRRKGSNNSYIVIKVEDNEWK